MRLSDFLDFHARERGDELCAVLGDRTLRYRDLLDQSTRLAHALHEAGLRPGDRFAFLSKNALEYLVVYCAASRTGTVVVPLNYRLVARELSVIVEDSQSKLVIARGEALAECIESVRNELPAVQDFVALDTPKTPGWQDYETWLAAQPTTPYQRGAGTETGLYQCYTSGTTGRPKGAVAEQGAIFRHLYAGDQAFALAPGTRMLVVMPMYHGAASTALVGSIARGGCMIIHEDFNPGEVVRALSEDGVTQTSLVPAMIQVCLVAVPDVAERRYDDLQSMAYGGSAISEETLHRAMEVFGCDFVQGYGLTESISNLTVLTAADHRRALDDRPELLLSAGRPMPGIEIRVVGEDGQPLAVGQTGEIVARGDRFVQGYWGLPEESAATFREGWLHTGDAGVLDEEGYLFIRDRIKDMIVSGAENVFPHEVENVLFAHPSVVDVAVIGVPDERFGEAVKAIVVLAPEAPENAGAISDFCRERLAGYKCPRSIDFAEALPRNASGKVLKRELRERYWKGHKRRIS